ncbi:MAG TPA: hypothetical protein ENF63_00060 [Candidatus Bathyarchaeota archaeon]|nr:hypothetical protein [Candidatus Bathyarchaeota archaeon]
MNPRKKTSLSNSFRFGFDDKFRFVEGIVGGIALAWLIACILSWILNILPVDWSSALTTTTASVAILLMFLGFCSFFAISIASALREGNYGLYSISSFSAFWIIFIVLSYIYGLNSLTSLFFNQGILCMIQIMIAYTLTIYTLSDTKAINIKKSDSYIIGVVPFIALLIFLVVQQQIFGEQIQFGAVIEPVLWVVSVIIAALVGYLLHAVMSK